MNRPQYKLSPEYCAQRRSHPANPALVRYLSYLSSQRRQYFLLNCADLGCGKLRHLDLLRPLSKKLVLVDTQQQLLRLHSDAGHEYSIARVAKNTSDDRHSIVPMTVDRFKIARMQLDVVFCVAVFDCILRPTRRMLIRAAERNLCNGGLFVVITPRNDSSILRRCSDRNKYKDGHVFHHHGVTTFFRNFVTSGSIRRDCEAMGLKTVR